MNEQETKFDFDTELQFNILQLCVQDYSWACSVGLEIIESHFLMMKCMVKFFGWIKYLMNKFNSTISMSVLKRLCN